MPLTSGRETRSLRTTLDWAVFSKPVTYNKLDERTEKPWDLILQRAEHFGLAVLAEDAVALMRHRPHK